MLFFGQKWYYTFLENFNFKLQSGVRIHINETRLDTTMTMKVSFYLETPDARIPGDIVMDPAGAAGHASAAVAAQQPLLHPHRAPLLLLLLHVRAWYGGVPRRAHHQLALRPHFSLFNPFKFPPTSPASILSANLTWGQQILWSQDPIYFLLTQCFPGAGRGQRLGRRHGRAGAPAEPAPCGELAVPLQAAGIRRVTCAQRRSTTAGPSVS